MSTPTANLFDLFLAVQFAPILTHFVKAVKGFLQFEQLFYKTLVFCTMFGTTPHKQGNAAERRLRQSAKPTSAKVTHQSAKATAGI